MGHTSDAIHNKIYVEIYTEVNRICRAINCRVCKKNLNAWDLDFYEI